MKTSTHSREFLSGVPYRSSRNTPRESFICTTIRTASDSLQLRGNGVLLLPDTITTIPFQSQPFNTQILFNYGGMESFFHLIQLQQFHSSPTVSTSVLWAGIFNTLYGGWEPSRNRVIAPAHQAKSAGGIHFLESIPGLHKRFKNTSSEWLNPFSVNVRFQVYMSELSVFETHPSSERL
jgi:hypothetical protein